MTVDAGGKNYSAHGLTNMKMGKCRGQPVAQGSKLFGAEALPYKKNQKFTGNGHGLFPVFSFA